MGTMSHKVTQDYADMLNGHDGAPSQQDMAKDVTGFMNKI
jgi:hypothetical protein